MKRLIYLFFCTVCLFSTSQVFGLEGPKTINMGFVPGRSPTNLIKVWSFLTRHLTNEVGIPVKMVISENYYDAMDAFLKGEIDILEGGAYVQGRLLEMKKAIPLVGEVKFGRSDYKSAIVVLKNSDISSIDDLKERIIAFTDELSTSGYIVPRLMLMDLGINDLNSFFKSINLSGSHKHSIDLLLRGEVDAIAIGDFFIEYLPNNIKNKLKILKYSEPFPLGPITYSPKLDPKIVQRLKNALLQIHNTVSFEALLNAQNERFTEFTAEQENSLVEIVKKSSNLTPISYSKPIRELPSEYGEQVKHLKKSSSIFIILPSLILILACGVYMYLKRERIREGKIYSIVFTSVLLVLIFSTIAELAIINAHFESQKSSLILQIDNLEKSILDNVSNNRLIDNNFAQRLIQESKLIKALRVFREGKYVLDTTKRSLGQSIVDNFIAGAFSLIPADSNSYGELFEQIWLGDRPWATAQILINTGSIKEYVYRIIFFHWLLLLIAFMSIYATLSFISKTLVKPTNKIAENLRRMNENVRERSATIQQTPSSSLAELADALAHTSENMVQKSAFLELKNSAYIKQFSHDFLKRAEKMIVELENKHQNFSDLRRHELIGKSPSLIRSIVDAIIRSKDSDPVLIYGESGSGKTGIAKTIHTLSDRSDLKFGEFNCAEFASADPLVVLGKLFGYGKNSGLTGIPNEGQGGLLKEYDGGTLFLDEVEILPAQAQRLLLLPLEGRPYNFASGLGSQQRANVRFIFASNLPLEDEIAKGNMRHDLLRRLLARGIIKVAPLRDRQEDISILADYFLQDLNKKHETDITFDQRAIEYITKLEYKQFNVSELKGLITVAFDETRFEEKSSIYIEQFIHKTTLAENKQTEISNQILDSDERKKLSVLRESLFNISIAEAKLGYSAGAKTLSNHFRGICYKVLTQSKHRLDLKEQDHIYYTANEIIGEASNRQLQKKVMEKINRFYTRVKDSNEAEREKLFNNLPQKYHQNLKDLMKI